jgi:branched-chain amino acid transport system substrate-binding protein
VRGLQYLSNSTGLCHLLASGGTAGVHKIVKIAQIAKTGLFPSQVEALGSLGDRLSSACYWHPDFPYSSSLTGISSKDLGAGYEQASGKQWNMQAGASMSLFDAGFAALKNSGAPNDKGAVAKALAGLKTVTMVGTVDFTSGPFPNVYPSSIIGTQWIKTKPGSKYKFDMVITENANDRKVPVSAKLLPLS